jgi:transcriptional regulator with XRE-family HTH domain
VNNAIYTSEHKAIINRLIQARKETGLTQAEIARKINRTQSYMSKIEAGQRRLDITQIKLLAEIYKKNISFFLED